MNSHLIKDAGQRAIRSKVIKAAKNWADTLKAYDVTPNGVFGSVAIIKSGYVTISSNDLDIEFSIPFDDDMEANEAEIIIYNLSAQTINELKTKASITVKAGYKNDTGIVFKGFITKISTKYDGADKVTTIRCIDDVTQKSVENLTFASNTKASEILKSLIDKTGIPVAVYKVRRDYVYTSDQTVDGDLMGNIKKYAQVCGISVYVNKGQIYARHIKEGDNINFTVQPDTGLIGYPEPYEEELTAEDFKETINGYEITMLLQHRMTTAAIVNLTSKISSGSFRVRSGEHTFNSSECITKIKVF